MTNSTLKFRDSEVRVCATCGSQFFQIEPDPSDLLVTPEEPASLEPEVTNVNIIFLKCFSSCADDDSSDCLEIDPLFCEPCTKQLMEWNRKMNFVSELLSQANKIKLNLTAKILQNSKLSTSVDCVHASDNAHKSSCSRINRVVRRIRAGKLYKPSDTNDLLDKFKTFFVHSFMSLQITAAV